MTARVVLYEGPGSRPLGAERRRELVALLLERGLPVTRVAHGQVVRAPAPDERHVLVGDLEPSLTDDPPRVVLVPWRDRPTAQVVDEVAALAGQDGATRPWKPWFPVLDYDRCTNCMQCLTFCLFDVYGVDGDGKIEVRNQSNCKTDCPACSRVCPEAAIMFPKYRKGPIHGGEVRDEDVTREAMKVDISALLGGDVYGVLRERSAEARRRFSTERDASKALLERRRCLAKLGRELDIPPEVLMTLPSAGDIEERTRRAREKEVARLARSRTVADRKADPTDDDWGI